MNVVLGMALLLLIAVFSIITSKEKGNRRKREPDGSTGGAGKGLGASGMADG